jgi:GTP-binding protein HflX
LKINKETAVLVGITLPQNDELEIKEHLDELEFLAMTAGAITLKRFTQRLNKAHPKFFVGPGKLDEIKNFVEERNTDIVIFDEELTPAQLRNIETVLKCKILDRNNLILDIFATHAKTSQAKTQVDLAQCEYLLPRLTKMWSHLSRQKGGIGMKGPGEKEIETDRRIVRNKISLLKEKLKKIDQQNQTQRKARKEKIRVALVGYTNAGKSSVMNVLSDAEVLAENKLFATLDTTVRKVVLDRMPFLLSDTVGFIRKLPHTLVESFKSTLDEAREADILVHVVDISHPQYESQIKVVKDTLKEMKAGDKPMLYVFNKIDKYEPEGEEEVLSLDQKLEILKHTWLNGDTEKAVFISALKNFNTSDLRNSLSEMIRAEYNSIYPYGMFSDEMPEDHQNTSSESLNIH